MKSYFNIFAAAALLLGFTACSKSGDDINIKPEAQENLVEVVLGVDFASTKTTMASNGDVIWSSNDKIKVQVGTNAYDFDLKTGSGTTSATFSAVVPESDAAILKGEAQGTVTAYYPTSGAEVPSTQTYAEGTFADGMNPMTATFANQILTFTNNAAVVRVKGVSKYATSAVLSYTVSEQNYTVTMALTAGETAKDLYFVVVPGAKLFNLSIDSATAVQYEASESTVAGSRYNIICPAAKIGTKGYASLEDALAAATDGQTIEMLKDVTIPNSITISKNITIDLKSFTLTSNVSAAFLFTVADGKCFTLKGGSVFDGSNGAAKGLISGAATTEVSKVNFGTFNTAGTDNILFPMNGSTNLTLSEVTVTTNNNVVKTSGDSNTLVVTNGSYTDTKRNSGTHTFDLLEYDTSSAVFTDVTITSPDPAERQSCIETDATKGTSNIVLNGCTIKAAYGNTVYAAADMTVINCDIETGDGSNNSYHALSVESEHTVNVYGGTYKSLTTNSGSAALKIWTSGGIFKIYDEYEGTDAPVTIEGYNMFYIDSKNKSDVDDHIAEIYFLGENIATKGMWSQQHSAKAYVEGGTHNLTVWSSSNANTFILSGGTYTMDPRTNSCFKIVSGYEVVAQGTSPETWKVQKALPTYGDTGLKGIQVGTLIWAPVNCGYDASNYPYGKMYQWARCDGSGYNDGSTYKESGKQTTYTGSTQLQQGVKEPAADKKYQTIESKWWYAWSYSNGVTINTWPNKSTDPGYIENIIDDPCPTGWHVPTKAELKSLVDLSYTNVANVDASGLASGSMNGKLFGTAPNQVFIPYAGRILASDYSSNPVKWRNSDGYYWTSEATGTWKAHSLYISNYNKEWDYNVSIDFTDRSLLLSVRCVHD